MTSETRSRLAALIVDRNEALTTIAELESRLARLETLASATSPAESALAILDSREAAAMSAWAADPASEPPAPDVAERARLAAEVAAARATSAAARRAVESLASERARHAEQVDALVTRIDLLAAEIVADEVIPALADEVAETNRRLAVARQRLGEARETVLRASEAAPSHPGRLPVLRVVERLDADISAALAAPVPTDDGAWRGALADHLRALASDPAATFAPSAEPEPFDDVAAFERVRARLGIAA